MVFLLGAVACTSLVNIVLAFASRRGWDGRAVLGWNYLASAAAAGLLAALARPALYFPAPGLLAGALSGGMTGPSSMSFAVWFGLFTGVLYLLCLRAVEKSVRERAFQIARRVEAEYLVESPLTTGGAYNHASGMGIPSVLIERGGGGLWSRAEVEADKRDVRRILAYLGVLEAPPEAGEPVRDQLVLREAVYETAPETGCWYPALRPGDRFARGTVLGEVRDCFGERLHTCVARADGVVLYQTASLPVLKDGPMVAYGVLP